MNIITSRRTYSTMDNALLALDKACKQMGTQRDRFRYMVAVSPTDGRYVPTVVLASKDMHLALPLCHQGIMVVN